MALNILETRFHKEGYTRGLSGQKIVVDVSYEDTIFGGAKLLLVIECKCYAKPVDVGDVDEFFGKLTTSEQTRASW